MGAQGNFLTFLPSDNAGIKDSAQEEIIQLTSSDLGHLLAQDAKTFWQTVQSDASLHACIESYLRYKRQVDALKRTA